MAIKTLASIESFTGGLFASEIVSKPGASKYFRGSIIAYDSEIKEKFGIDISEGVISAEAAKQLAVIGKQFFNVDVCVAFTGNAGPIAMEGKPVGLVYIAINDQVYELKLKGSRNSIRKKAVKFALSIISSRIF